MNLIKVQEKEFIRVQSVHYTKESMLNDFKEVFDSQLGKMPGRVQLTVDPSVKNQ